MPIDTRLTAVVTVGPRPLPEYLARPGGDVQGAPGDRRARTGRCPGPIVVPVQGAEEAGIDSYLGAPAAEVIAALRGDRQGG